MIGKRIYIVLIPFLTATLMLGHMYSAMAQFSQLPVVLPKSINRATLPANRVQNEPLSLPFWDDFSDGRISEMHWESKGVMASMTMGVDPPSVGVVFLDGVDERGNPYERERLANGEGDQLLSMPVDLSSISASERETVFLSFFWQAGGRGEMPDAIDQLELYFLDLDGDWNKVWETFGGDAEEQNEFTQELVRLSPEYFHEGFRFRFQVVGRLSGPFDTWLLDYIYLDKGRSPSDYFFEDRTLTRLPGSPFGKYTAIPHFFLETEANGLLDVIEGQFKNLSNRFRAMEYTIQLRNSQDNSVISNVNLNTPLNPVPSAQERRDFSSRVSETIDWREGEPFDLETLMYLSTGDQWKVAGVVAGDTIFEPSIDYRINDTVRTIIPIRDFLAYDNGSADYSAGINQTSGMLALRYDTPQPVYVSGVSVNFTNFLQRGNAIELMIWDSLERRALYRKEVLIPETEEKDEFAYFPLDTNIMVNDSFFVGFMQFTNDFIYVGLDKTTDTGEEIFFNVYGVWEQNAAVRGSLMIRPHLSLEQVVDIVEEEQAEISAFPNPVLDDRLTIHGDFEDLVVYDFQGREIKVFPESVENGKIINFTGQHRGVYLIRVMDRNNKLKYIRIILK